MTETDYTQGSDPETVTVPRAALQVLFDTAVSSMDFGSGFWDTENTAAAREVAVLLGVNPVLATPANHRAAWYPLADDVDAARLAVYRRAHQLASDGGDAKTVSDIFKALNDVADAADAGDYETALAILKAAQ